MPYIEVSQLSKSFQTQRGPVSVLGDLEFAVETGEMVAIVGASGVGKSTLLQLLGGLDFVDSGSIVVGGVDIATLSDGERITFRHSQVGFVFQFHHLPVGKVPELLITFNPFVRTPTGSCNGAA